MRIRWRLLILSVLTILLVSSQRISPIQAQSSGFDCSAVTELPKLECEALVTFYQGTNGPNWNNKDGWLITNTPCSWYGVTCDAGHISKLEFSHPNGLSGHIPPDLGNLFNLKYLVLSYNDLFGNIPSELGRLAHLEVLELVYTKLSGPIPPELGQLTRLKYLDLFRTEVSGNIPPELGNLANLELLTFGCSAVSGNVPPELGRLAKLKYLLLTCFPGHSSENHLTGALPLTLINLKNLEEIWINSDKLCEPADTSFQTWLNGIKQANRSRIICDLPLQMPETGSDRGGMLFVMIGLGFLFLLLGGWIRLQT